eukprot:scaffold5856_cov159-Skeletonema_dohrnii-CCMP3373.AAC.2
MLPEIKWQIHTSLPSPTTHLSVRRLLIGIGTAFTTAGAGIASSILLIHRHQTHQVPFQPHHDEADR